MESDDKPQTKKKYVASSMIIYNPIDFFTFPHIELSIKYVQRVCIFATVCSIFPENSESNCIICTICFECSILAVTKIICFTFAYIWSKICVP